MINKSKIISIKPLNSDVSLFKVEKPSSFSFVPGHSIMTSISKPSLTGKQIPLTPISLNSDLFLEFIIKKYPGKMTAEFHKLRKDDSIILKEMFGSVRYVSKGLFIAGGIGIAPFLAIFRQLKKDNQISGNKLIYSNGRKEDILFEEELVSMLGRDNVIITLTKENNKNYLNGRISPELIKKNLGNEMQFYVAGSDSFISDIKSLCQESVKK